MVISWNSNQKHVSLEHLLKKVLPEHNTSSRSTITNLAIREWAEASKKEGLEEKNDRIKNLVNELHALTELPNIPQRTAMKADILESNCDDYSEIVNSINLALGMQKVRTQYVIAILWINLLKSLNSKETKQIPNDLLFSSLKRSEIIANVCEIIYEDKDNNQIYARKIVDIILEWNNKEDQVL